MATTGCVHHAFKRRGDLIFNPISPAQPTDSRWHFAHNNHAIAEIYGERGTPLFDQSMT